MLAQNLAKAWDDQRRSAPIDPMMRFSSHGLVIGADTVLVAAGASARDVRIDPHDRRLQVLLTAAHGEPPTGAQLAFLAKAGERWREGDDALAATHLSLSGLSQLVQPGADAHRLFLADGLLEAGATTATVLAALRAIAKYDANQLRVPAGSPAGGEWTAGDGGDASASAAPAQAPEQHSLTPRGPHSEVNPQTVTPTAGGVTIPFPSAFGDGSIPIARADCIEHALEDDGSWFDSPHANDNLKPQTLRRVSMCIETTISCVRAFDRLAESGRNGQVVCRFPDGGIIINKSGAPAVYFRAHAWGTGQFRRRSSDTPLPAPPQHGGVAEPSGVETPNYAWPPWTAAPDETPATGGAQFQECEGVLDHFAAEPRGVISDRQYTMSREWGGILRAKVARASLQEPFVFAVVCWTGLPPMTGASIAFQIESPKW